MFADARLRDRLPGAVVDVLRGPHERFPEDDGIARRLGLAYVLAGRYREALPVLDAYLSRQPDDQEMLFAAVVSWYQASAGQPLAEGDREKLARYAAAYRGPHAALAAKFRDAADRPR
jgi:hypothetical protein